MKMFRHYFLLLAVLFLKDPLKAQNYQAIHGSSYAGSLSPANNPSSIVHVPYSWDVTVFAFQAKEATNALRIENYSLFENPSNAEIEATNGTKRRLGYANQNLRLLNARIAINPKMAFAFGVNIKSYAFIKTSKYTWQDSINTLRKFGAANISNTPLSGNAVGASWAEIYGTYAQTIKDDGNSVLNAGITFKVDRGLAGAYATAEDINYLPNATNNDVGYLLEQGSLKYGYSSNLDDVNNNSGASSNRNNFLRRTFSSMSFDAGLEYIVLSDEKNDYNYDTKLGISLMDVGRIKFGYGEKSRYAIAGKNDITDSLLQNSFQNISSFNQFNDSLATVSNSISALGGDFFITQPTRLVLNADKHFSGNLFVNAELTLPIFPAAVKNKLYLRDMNLLAITPRWENRTFGIYLPIQFNQVKQLWVGGAFKAGPLLLGIHNWANLFSKKSMQNGGMYLALIIRPGSGKDKSSRDPAEKLSRKERRKLDCPHL